MANTKTTQVSVAVGVAAAAAAAAAGAYWLYGAKDASKNRAKVRGWMLRARGEVMEALEKLQDVDRDTYMAIVDTVIKRYSGLSGITSAELSSMARDLKGAWNHIQGAKKSGLRAAKKGKRATKKAVKRASKK